MALTGQRRKAMLESLAKIVGIIAVFLIVYAVLALYNKFAKRQGRIVRRLIPLWAMLLGIFLGIFVYSVFPEIMPAPSLFTSVILGAITGLAATGLNQLMRLFDNDEEEEKKKDEKHPEKPQEEPSKDTETK